MYADSAGVDSPSSPLLPMRSSSLVGTIAPAINRPSDAAEAAIAAAEGETGARQRAAMGAIWRTHFRLGAAPRVGMLPLWWMMPRKEEEAPLSGPVITTPLICITAWKFLG